jgi:hypothetical protein
VVTSSARIPARFLRRRFMRYFEAATMWSTALMTDWSERSVRPPFGGM